MKNKTLKVSSITTIYEKATFNSYGKSTVPFIRLAGRYLEQGGINIGDTVNVEIENGKIIISKV